MTRAPRKSSDQLDVNEDRPFQERWWTIERFAWGGFALIFALALVGLTGSGGWFADATASGSGGSVDYPRLSRWQADDTVSVTFAASPEPTRTLTLSSAFTSLFQIVDVEPRATAATATQGGEDLEFRVVPGAPATIDFHVRSQHPGVVGYYMAIDGERLDAITLVLP
jgi:hypothetical protein